MLEWLQTAWQSIYGVISDTVLSSFPLVHVILLIMAGCLGSMLAGRCKPALGDALLRVLGILTVLMGASRLWDSFFVLQTAQFETEGTLLVLISLIVGYAFGAALGLEKSFERLGGWLSRKFIKEKPARPSEITRQKNPLLPAAEGFAIATVLCGFGASTIGSCLNNVLGRDALPLLAALGFSFLAVFLLAVLGGVAPTLAVIPVLAVEAILFLAYTLWGDLLTHTLVNQFCLIGAVTLMAAGLDMASGKKVRAARFLPAYLIPVIYGVALLWARKMMESA
jgi:uncharacterized membrane protein YqgA involved in biofilm formation